jgi:hypothetical protein
LSASDFTKVVIADEAKDFHRTAWLRVPGAPVRASEPADDSPAGDTLAVAVRFLASMGDYSGIVEQVLVPSLEESGIVLSAPFTADDPVFCLRGVHVFDVLGRWVSHLDQSLRSRAPGIQLAVGVCPAPDRVAAVRAAKELASSETAARVLPGAREGRVAIVIPDYVHRTLRRGRLAPQSYRPAEHLSWLRVVGHSKPPRPVEGASRESAHDGRQSTEQREPDTGYGSIIAYGDKSAAVGHGVFGDLHFGDVYGRDGRP